MKITHTIAIGLSSLAIATAALATNSSTTKPIIVIQPTTISMPASTASPASKVAGMALNNSQPIIPITYYVEDKNGAPSIYYNYPTNSRYMPSNRVIEKFIQDRIADNPNYQKYYEENSTLKPIHWIYMGNE
jgi:hypothetical protein